MTGPENSGLQSVPAFWPRWRRSKSDRPAPGERGAVKGPVGGMPTLGLGDPSNPSLLGLGFPAASVGAAHLGTLVFGKLGAVIR